MTPPSTPPAEEEEFLSTTDSTDALMNEISSESLIDMMYERYLKTAIFILVITFFWRLKDYYLLILSLRYTLDLSDIQMVVCNVKDNWSEVASKPPMTSDVHVVDKFTIAIQMERWGGFFDFLKGWYAVKDCEQRSPWIFWA